MRLGWLIATALAYGVIGGYLLYGHLWDEHGGRAWTGTATTRLLWAAAVFLVSTVLLARRHAGRGERWIALHAAAAFVLGAAVTWGTVESLMLSSEHPWDTDVADFLLYCVSCTPRAPIVRQALLATLIGTAAAAGLAPLIPRIVRSGKKHPPSAAPHA